MATAVVAAGSKVGAGHCEDQRAARAWQQRAAAAAGDGTRAGRQEGGSTRERGGK